MNKKLGHISKIISGEKIIESRWYCNKIAPWGKIEKGDTIYFKNSGGPIMATAVVDKILQIEGLNNVKFNDIIKKYADKIKLIDRKYSEYYKTKKYVILLFLKDPKSIEKPFYINKQGFGSACAWMCVNEIESIRMASKDSK